MKHPIAPGRGTVTARVALEGKIVHIPDVLADAEYAGSEYVKRGRISERSWRSDFKRRRANRRICALRVRKCMPFTERQIELVTTFADSGCHRHREHTAIQASCANLCSSRPPPPTCSRSSAAPPLICKRCCKPSLNQLPGSAMPIRPSLPARKTESSTAPKHTAFLANSWIMSEIFRSTRTRLWVRARAARRACGAYPGRKD